MGVCGPVLLAPLNLRTQESEAPGEALRDRAGTGGNERDEGRAPPVASGRKAGEGRAREPHAECRN